jgi:hypothetical protein
VRTLTDRPSASSDSVGEPVRSLTDARGAATLYGVSWRTWLRWADAGLVPLGIQDRRPAALELRRAPCPHPRRMQAAEVGEGAGVNAADLGLSPAVRLSISSRVGTSPAA